MTFSQAASQLNLSAVEYEHYAHLEGWPMPPTSANSMSFAEKFDKELEEKIAALDAEAKKKLEEASAKLTKYQQVAVKAREDVKRLISENKGLHSAGETNLAAYKKLTEIVNSFYSILTKLPDQWAEVYEACKSLPEEEALFSASWLDMLKGVKPYLDKALVDFQANLTKIDEIEILPEILAISAKYELPITHQYLGASTTPAPAEVVAPPLTLIPTPAAPSLAEEPAQTPPLQAG